MMMLLQSDRSQLVHSASDLTAFLECEALIALNLKALSDPALAALRVADDESTKLMADKGIAHEKAYLQHLRDQGKKLIDIAEVAGRDNAQRLKATRQAMAEGAEVIYQAALGQGDLMGHADFLIRVDLPSTLGNWSYEVADTKLARSAKAKFLVQLSFYGQLLSAEQGVAPQNMHVVLGDQSMASYRCADYDFYVKSLLARYRLVVDQLRQGTRASAYPLPCAHCPQCQWRAHCESRRTDDDHLSQIAGIRKQNIVKLESAGVHTMAALADLPPATRVPSLHQETLTQLQRQATLQTKGKQDSQLHLELLPVLPGALRGFARMPAPDEGDLFFDMEGNPLQDGGLEYLFGLWFKHDAQWQFKAFWAHDRAQEQRAFEACIDFIMARWQQFPRMHVYHYASYEETAFKRLACTHATRERELDDLLRGQVLVDLYKVVREALCISQPSYSIKYVEHFYRGSRGGDVTNAGASIVFYERWRDTGEAQLLQDIEDYNRDDVESTQQLRDWLLGLRAKDMPWRETLPFASASADAPDQAKGDTAQDSEGNSGPSAKTLQVQARLAKYRERLLSALPEDPQHWTEDDQLRVLIFQLLGFHQRSLKPQWWSIYAKAELSEEELLEDPECLAGLQLDPAHPAQKILPEGRKKETRIRYTFTVPEQISKLEHGDRGTFVHSTQAAPALHFDEAKRQAILELKEQDDPLPAVVHLGPKKPIDQATIENAVFAFADDFLQKGQRFAAGLAFLRRAHPRIQGREPGQAIAPAGKDLLQACIDAALGLDRSYLYVQGPPGSGKTYTGSRMIAALLAEGKRVGVMSNSHKAIHHLMHGAMQAAKEQGIAVRAVKKATKDAPESQLQGAAPEVMNVFKNEEAVRAGGNLIGGTAWLFSTLDSELDCLFVDEAGQVSLANLIACSGAARNLVLLGDQMQLGQPTQGVHPGQSGESALDYLLDGAATIAPDKGIFLATTWRMHPEICSFISQAIYEGRLQPEPRNALRTLVLPAHAHALLRPSGIVHVPIQHAHCSQRSLEEAQLTKAIYESALQAHYTDDQGMQHPITQDNILVVAPYNLQVKLLQKTLPAGARVGTVDKFQGQEAEVVIVSMTTSSESDLPRHLEFLYSKNRLNVAISRAKCLAIVLANPGLLAIQCQHPQDMALVNTLCWLSQQYGSDITPTSDASS
jgi:predicted RecB family nuclease